MSENEISFQVRKAAFTLHTELGPGLLESVYETALAYELRKAGLHVSTQVPLPMVYGGVTMDIGFRLDLVVEGKIIVEIKSVEALQRCILSNC